MVLFTFVFTEAGPEQLLNDCKQVSVPMLLHRTCKPVSSSCLKLMEAYQISSPPYFRARSRYSSALKLVAGIFVCMNSLFRSGQWVRVCLCRVQECTAITVFCLPFPDWLAFQKQKTYPWKFALSTTLVARGLLWESPQHFVSLLYLGRLLPGSNYI